MVIPKGKKFQFIVFDYDNTSKERINRFEKRRRIKGDAASTSFVQTLNSPAIIEIPPYGYLGNALIGQDVNLSLNSTFVKPLEGILGRIPHTIDLAYQASQGVSLNNAKFTHLKYWTGTESPEISLQLVFETQVDSYYDVYRPVRDLMRLALPEETEFGFYKAPVPTVKYIAEEAATYFSQVSDKIVKIIGGSLTTREGQIQTEKTKASIKSMSGELKGLAHNSVEKTGFGTNLYVGNNFFFKDVIVKSVSPTFSSELAYAPIHWLNGKVDCMDPERIPPKGWFNPYKMGEILTKTYAQTVCAAVAMGNNAAQAGLRALKALPGGLSEKLNGLKDLPSFPIRAEVNITFELLYPLTRNLDKFTSNSISTLFDIEGFNKLY